MLLVSNDTTKERSLCVERFATLSLPKCRNGETSNMFRTKPNHCISSGRNMLLVSNDITKERHLCVERFATFLLPKCRNAETSNMFLNKHNHCICCSFPFHQSSILAKQNSIISDDCAHLSYYSISKSPTMMSPRK